MLFGERVRDRAGRRVAERDERLAERFSGLGLCLQGVRELLRAQESFLDHQLTKLPTCVWGRVHDRGIGVGRLALEQSSALARQGPEDEGKPVDADDICLHGE